MTITGLNVSTGIDAGSSCSKLAYSDAISTRSIARCEGFDPLELREEAEIFFDEPVFSCVIAVPEEMSLRHKDGIKHKAEISGFRDVNIITAHEAMALGLGSDERVLVYDFGASRSEMVVLEDGEVLESVIVPDVCGDEFDCVFAEYLCERRLMKKVNEELLREAKRIKHVLSDNPSRIWHSTNIMREDFERLIYFSVKRASHTVNRLIHVWKPESFILTGGCANIPLVREMFGSAEVIDDVIVKGVSLKAFSLTRQEARKNIADTASRMREIRAEILGIEDRLTRSQKDRLYVMFRQVEGMNDAGMITLMENLIREIRNVY